MNPAHQAAAARPVAQHPWGEPALRPPAGLGGPDPRQALPAGGLDSYSEFAPASAISPEDPGRVVVVEDDAKLAAVIERAFVHSGLTTSTAITGDAALAAMRHDTPIAAVILDIMIPHPDGIEVCRQLRRDGWDGPIVIISALDGPDTRARARRAGADAFIPKPFHLAELLGTVQTLVDHTPQRHPPRSRGATP